MRELKDAKILDELRPFFYPRAVAIAGVSQDTTKVGSNMLRSMQRFGFGGAIYPVGQRITELYGLPVFPSISAVPSQIDLVRICVPAQYVLNVVQECKAKGVPAVEIISGGFKETGTDEGRKLESTLASIAGNGLRIIGPNCFGVYCPEGGITHFPGQAYPREAGFVGVISQSGGISEDICFAGRDYGFRFSKVVSYGNACDVNETDLLRYFEADDQTKFVAMYIEGVRNGREFFQILQRITQIKPVILWKGGLTPEGARAAASHTASLAGSESIWNAIFRQSLAIPVDTLQDLLDTVTAFYQLPPLADSRVAIVCGTGGTSIAATDICYREGLTMPHFSSELRQRLESMLPPIGPSAKNPVDTGTPFSPPAKIFREILEIIATSGIIGSIIIDKIAMSANMRQLLGYAEQMSWEEEPWFEEIPVQVRKNYGVPVVVVLREGGDQPDSFACEAERRRLRNYYQQNGVPVFPTITRALKSLGRVVRYYLHQQAI